MTREAHYLGMAVEYRPLVRVGPSWRWEGHINPPDQRAWFASLFKAELPYLKVAQRLHVREFVVGTELHRLSTSRQWPWFLSKVRSVYHGAVSFAAWQKDYYTQPASLPPTSEYGVDPYPHVNLPPTATVGQLVAAWDRYFSHVPAAILGNTVMQEVGIPALDGAYHHPELWAMRGAPNQQVQARWFKAACEVVHQYHMRGIYFYEVNLTDDPARPLPFSAFFEGKQGASAIRSCLKTFHP